MGKKISKETAKELGRKGGLAKSAKQTQWENILGYLVGEGGQAFKDKLQRLSCDTDLGKAEKEFMQHYKDLLEYHQPKLARNDNVNKHEIELPQPILAHVLETKKKK